MSSRDAIRPAPGSSTYRPTEMRRKRVDVGAAAIATLNYTTLIFLLLPIVIVVATSFTSGRYVTFPPELPLSLRWYKEFFERDLYLAGLKNSLITGGLVVAVSGSIGLLAAVGWTMRKFRGKQLVYHLLFLPFLVPGLVIGIGLLMSLGPLHLSALVGNRWAVVIGHCLWATPLVFIVMVSVLQGIDWALVDAAKSLGARPIRTFYEITLPLVRPGVIASLILAFVVSFHEFIIALFLTGSSSRTLPVLVWNSLRLEVSPIIAAIDAMMIITIVIALIVLAKSVGIERIRMR